MISGAPSQDSLLPDNRHAADYQHFRHPLLPDLNLQPPQLHDDVNLTQARLDSIKTSRLLTWCLTHGERLTLP
ncbi:hypothetical protein N2S64_04395, partial [Escherichia coli]|nr:hypothetical protein [Escherichia coli]